MNWLILNQLVANPEKFKLIFFGLKEDHEVSVEGNGDVIKMSGTGKFLFFTIESKLRFNEHVQIIYQKTNKVKAFQGMQGTWDPRRLAYYTTHLY